MADFTPTKHTANEFNNGNYYVNYDVVQPTTLNRIIEATLYAEEQADNASDIANEAMDKITEAVNVNVVQNGTYPNMTVGNATNAVTATTATNAVTATTATNAVNADNAINATNATKALTATTATYVLNPPAPAVGMHHIQFSGEPTPAEIYSNTTWEIDTNYQGKTIIGSGGNYSIGATGGEATVTLTTAQIPSHTHYMVGSAGNGQKAIPQSPNSALGSYNDTNTSTNLRYELFAAPDVATRGKTSAVGSGSSHENMPPYKVVNVWKRTA